LGRLACRADVLHEDVSKGQHVDPRFCDIEIVLHQDVTAAIADVVDSGESAERVSRDIVRAGINLGYQFCAVTDHGYGLRIARGVSMAQLARQHKAIDDLNRTHGDRFRLLKGIEANIRADGTIDMERHELALLEIVVAAPHSALRTSADQTARMVKAVSAPGVHILGHPRGRKIGARPGVSADWDRVFKAAARSGVAIEIDGDPSRQDLDYDIAKRALDAGCLFALDSDAHATRELAPFAATALAHARLAGIRPERIINCWTLERLLEWARRRQA
jgi:histidinol phosphatase-like PHP family hydrolase